MRHSGHATHGFARRVFSGFLLSVLLTLTLVGIARTVPPKYFDVSDARLEVGDNAIVARLAVGVDNLTGLYEMLKDGASVELVISAKLERVRTLWPNVLLTEMELFSALQHNPLTREFSLYMPGEAKPMLDKQLERLLAATWSKLSVNFGSLDLLDGEKGSSYRATLRLALQHAKPPPWLAKNFMFWSKDIVDPETVVMEFTR